MGLILLQNGRIQNYLTQKISRKISETLQTRITLENASFTFINRVLLKNIYIEDLNGDSLLFARRMVGVISGFDRNKKEIRFSRIIMEDAYIHFVTDTTGSINLRFIIDRISGKGSGDSARTTIKFRNIEIRESRFHYEREGRVYNTTGIQYSDMDFRDLNLKIRDFVIEEGTISFHLNNLSLKEKSGFTVNSLDTRMKIAGNLMHFDELSVWTPYSTIASDSLHFDFKGFYEFSDFVHLVNLEASFSSALVSFKDISFFASSLKGYNEKFKLTGVISGQINNLLGDHVIVSYSDATSIQGSFTMIGLPDFKYTFINFDLENFRTHVDDLKRLSIPGKTGPILIKLPSPIFQLGEINYSGKFTGYPDDFVAYGNFSTDLGIISTDILLRPDTSDFLAFQGSLKTMDFNIGRLAESEEKLGRMTMSAKINGLTSGQNIKAVLDGVIDSLELFNYNYTGIQLKGTLTDKNFDGSFHIADPNIELDFAGKVDFTKLNPEFDFTADVIRAKPYFLNITKSDSSFFLSFLLKSNFTGRTIDEFNGEIRLVNSLFRQKSEQVQVYDLVIQSETDQNTRNFAIRSDFLDGDMNGNFLFSNLFRSFQDFASGFIPSLVKTPERFSRDSGVNNLTFDLRFKNIQPVLNFFIPALDIASKSHIYGFFNADKNSAELNIESAFLSYRDHEWRNFRVTTTSSANSVKINSASDMLLLKNDISLENFMFSATIAGDSSEMDFDWASKQKPRYEGDLNITANFSENKVSGNPIVSLFIDSSMIAFEDLPWIISPGNISKDSSSVSIDSFKIAHENQGMIVNGRISDIPDDGFTFLFRNLDLSLLNYLTQRINLKTGGKISGIATLKDPYNRPVFLSDLKLQNFTLNDEEFGNGEILANWNNDSKKIHIKTFAGTGTVPSFLIEGDYSPKTSGIDLRIALDKFRLNPLLPYADFLISDLKGITTGQLFLTGTLKRPELNGRLDLMKTSLLVDYLKTRYNFTNEITFSKNNIVLKNFEIFDQKGNPAVCDGRISNNYFRDFRLDIKLLTKNFEFLNTTEKDNQLFYGNIFAGGTVGVTGPVKNLQLDINAKSGKNSLFSIPLYGSDDISENPYIYWVNSFSAKENQTETPGRYQVDVKGMILNFKLEVTPDAEVQLIFDPKIGDIIRGKGNGNLNISVNTNGKFEIFGDINIEEGDYLFTLQNLINKRFKVEKGGRIEWRGDPEDANIDLKAYYTLRTSVYPLLEDPLSDPNAESLKKRIPVDCIIGMKGKLMNPTIAPGIALPTADQQTQNIVKTNINTEEELMKQFISLLVLNSFYSSRQGIASQGGGTGTNTFATAGVTGSELISNQLSHWLSQISKDFNIGLNYRPGDEITTDELEVALSTQIFNDRLYISGNVDMGGNNLDQSTSANNIVGDFEINYKITDKFHVKGFNRANDNLLFQTAPYTQGVGVFYRESFNNLKELWSRYKEGLKDLFSKRKKKPEQEVPATVSKR